MSKYEFIISAKDKTGEVFDKVNSRLGDTSKIAAKVGTAIVGVTTAMTALTVRAAENAKEVESLSRLAGMGVEDFQAMSFAFERFNVSQEKFADISKDVQDKLGDFMATGAGPFADFFEQVAPKVDLTVDALKDLSSTDALIAVKKAMDDANVSAKEQVFYMEAIASDATLLLPALKNNGEAIHQYASEFRALNVAMSQADIKKMKDLANEFDRIEAIADSIGNKIAANFSEPLGDMLEVVDNSLPEHLLRLENATRGFAYGLLEASSIISKVNEYNPFAQMVAGMTGGDTEEMTRYFDDAAKRMGEGIERVQAQLRGEKVNYSGGYGPVENILQGMGLFKLEDAATNIVIETGESVRSTFLDILSDLDDIQGGGFDLNKALGFEDFWKSYAPKSVSSKDILGDIQYEKIDLESAFGEDKFWEEFDTTGLLNLTPEVDLAEASAQSQQLIDNATATFAAIHEERLQFAGMDEQLEQERYQRQLELMEAEVALIEKKGLLTQELEQSYMEAREDAEKNHLSRLSEIREEREDEQAGYWEKWLGAAEENLTDFDELSANTIENFSNRMGSAVESMVFDSESLGEAFYGVMEGMARSVVNALGQMAAQWVAYQLVQMTVGKATALSGVPAQIANAQAASIQAGINAFSSTAAIPVVGPALAPGAMGAALSVTQPMAAAVASIATAGAAASFEGGGYTGSGIRAGGLDGRGGYMAMLHPQEYVTDFTKQQTVPQRGGDSYVTHIHAMDADSVQNLLVREGKHLSRGLAKYGRRNG